MLTTPSNVLPLNVKQTFPPIIWVFTEDEGIKTRLPFKIFSTLIHIAMKKVMPFYMIGPIESIFKTLEIPWYVISLMYYQRWDNLNRYFQFIPILKRSDPITVPQHFNLKFSFSEKATKMWAIVLMILTFTQYMSKPWGQLQIFVAFSEKLNFKVKSWGTVIEYICLRMRPN